jgi:repressor of nif and glnA expression
LKVVLQNSTTRGFSYVIIAKEVRKRGYKIIPRIIWKVLIYTGYF